MAYLLCRFQLCSISKLEMNVFLRNIHFSDISTSTYPRNQNSCYSLFWSKEEERYRLHFLSFRDSLTLPQLIPYLLILFTPLHFLYCTLY